MHGEDSTRGGPRLGTSDREGGPDRDRTGAGPGADRNHDLSNIRPGSSGNAQPVAAAPAGPSPVLVGDDAGPTAPPSPQSRQNDANAPAENADAGPGGTAGPDMAARLVAAVDAALADPAAATPGDHPSAAEAAPSGDALAEAISAAADREGSPDGGTTGPSGTVADDGAGAPLPEPLGTAALAGKADDAGATAHWEPELTADFPVWLPNSDLDPDAPDFFVASDGSRPASVDTAAAANLGAAVEGALAMNDDPHDAPEPTPFRPPLETPSRVETEPQAGAHPDAGDTSPRTGTDEEPPVADPASTDPADSPAGGEPSAPVATSDGGATAADPSGGPLASSGDRRDDAAGPIRERSELVAAVGAALLSPGAEEPETAGATGPRTDPHGGAPAPGTNRSGPPEPRAPEAGATPGEEAAAGEDTADTEPGIAGAEPRADNPAAAGESPVGAGNATPPTPATGEAVDTPAAEGLDEIVAASATAPPGDTRLSMDGLLAAVAAGIAEDAPEDPAAAPPADPEAAAKVESAPDEETDAAPEAGAPPLAPEAATSHQTDPARPIAAASPAPDRSSGAVEAAANPAGRDFEAPPSPPEAAPVPPASFEPDETAAAGPPPPVASGDEAAERLEEGAADTDRFPPPPGEPEDALREVAEIPAISADRAPDGDVGPGPSVPIVPPATGVVAAAAIATGGNGEGATAGRDEGDGDGDGDGDGSEAIARAAAGEPPVAARHPSSRTVHGVTLEDPYAWLRADNWRAVMADPSVLAAPIRRYLEAENAYADHLMAPLEPLRQTLLAELRGRIKEDDSTVPEPDGQFAYALRYTAGAEHPRVVRTTRHGLSEKTLLDANHEAVGTAYFRLAAAEHSPNHRWLAWASDTTGGEAFTVRIRDTARERDLDDQVDGTAGAVAWASDNAHLFYVKLDENHRPASVWRHRRGTPAEEDVKVYEEADPGFFVGVGRSLCGRFVVIDSHDHETSECRLVPADRPLEAPHLVAERIKAEEYGLAPHASNLFILTNAGDAEDFKIVRAPLSTPGREAWTDVVPHRPGRLIVSMAVFDGHLVRLEREHGLPRIVVRRLSDGEEHAIAFEEEAYSLGLLEGYEFATGTLRFTYSSMTTPGRVYDYDMETRERTLRKEQEIPSGHDPSRYVTRRIMAPAPDGESVPVSLLHRADTAVDGTAPCLLYGYGAYGITIPASFNANALSLVDRGMVFAIAHVRGGKDKGFRWYREGRREHKENTFTDFLAVADHLVAEGFARPGGILAQGGSAGGMLMGVVANTGGERFCGIVAEVPFVDVLATMLDDTLPLTPPEWPEWGNPVEDKAAFHRIRGYSPYDNVAKQAYPPMLVLAGVTDPRVTYWEPAKWVAKLRATRTDDAPLVFRTNMGAGHGGASGRFARLHEVAFIQAFTLKAADLAD